MERLDFLFIYEHKVRELENLCLMKYELDRRGYRTKIIYINDANNALSPKVIYKTKVLCMMACYHNKTLRWHVKDFVDFEKIIDLQWENIVYPHDEHRENAYKNYKEVGKEVVHISWGKQNAERLIQVAHISPEKVKVTGHVGMDFLREPLKNYYLSKEELFKKYDIPDGHKVLLFASPYYSDGLPAEYIEDMCSRFGEHWREYYAFMCDSQKIVLQWFEKICTQDRNIIIIFRPHPGHPSLAAQELAEKCPNFRIIGEASVKQWIVTCDAIYTGNSSVIVEAYFARKNCQLLFPIDTTEGFELSLISDSKKIKNYDDFEKSIYSDNLPFPTPQKSIEEIYLTDWNEPCYIKFANAAEEILHGDEYRLSKKQLHNYKEYSFATRLVKGICRIDWIYSIYISLLQNKRIHWQWIEHQRKVREKAYLAEKQDSHETTSPEEIGRIINRIQYALETSNK